VSVNYGPLTYSLLIKERFVQKDSKETAIGDSKWQETADPQKWPSFEIYPASEWNYGLLLKDGAPAQNFSIIKKAWPADNNPWTIANAPMQLQAKGKKIPGWGIDRHGLCAELPLSPVQTSEAVTTLTLVPMGSARLRISAFPVVQ
jgi:hypothetical protein